MNIFNWLFRLLFIGKKTYTANIYYRGDLIGSIFVRGRFFNLADAWDNLAAQNNTDGALVDVRRVE